MVSIKKQKTKRKPFYTILNLVTAEYIEEIEYTDWDSNAYRYNTRNIGIRTFRTEEEAYKYLFNEYFNTWQGRERNLQITLLIAELTKLDQDIAYKIFLNEDKEVKAFNHVTLFGYFRTHKLYKTAFKAFCDVVAVMGLSRTEDRICFEHFAVTEHPANTDISKL